MQSVAGRTPSSTTPGKLISHSSRALRTRVTLVILVFAAIGCQASRPNVRAITTRPAPTPAERAKFGKAKDLFYASVAGDHAALAPAEQILQELGGGDSPDPRVVAYTGAAKLLQASRTPNFFEKAGLGRQGIDLEERAVAEAPDDLEVRFLRGVTYYQLPPFLGRHQLAVDDLSTVARAAESAAKAGRLDPRAAAADLVYYGKAREAAYDLPGAIAAWRAALRVDPDSPGGHDALKHLEEHHVST
jgi:tetratricopeptide (TPR) repeat protein